MKSVKIFVVTVGLILIAGPICAQAGMAIDFAVPGMNFTNGNWSLGWEFSVKQPLVVKSLGFYDDQGNGLTQSHDVGIFDSAQVLIVSGQVTPNDPLVSWWRWTAVTPTLLVPGQYYQIAAVTGAENYTWAPTGFVVDPLVNYVQDSYFTPAGGALVYPNASDAVVGYFGPNFNSTVVPLPSAAVLFVLGAATVALKRRQLR